MEDQVTNLGSWMGEVKAVQRQQLAAAHVLANVKMRPPVLRSFGSRFVGRLAWSLPRLRFTLPALAFAGMLALWWTTQSAPLSFSVGNEGANPIAAGSPGQSLEAPVDRAVPLHFSDGSSVTLAPGSRLQVAALERRGAVVQLERGRVDVSVRHRSQTLWRLRAGSFEVTVTGTRFSMVWEDRASALTVVMSEGTVEVRGRHLTGDVAIVVTAGQRFHVTAGATAWTLGAANAEEQTFGASAPLGSDPGPQVVPTPVAGPTPAEAPPAASEPAGRGVGAGTSLAPRSWQILARSGRYQEALDTVERFGFARACKRLGAEDLVQLGDAARLAGNAPRAEQAYRVARRRFPGADRPAFALGLVAFEQRRDFRAAAKWFESYVRQYPSGQLAREALGRELESWHRAGDQARARRAASQYLEVSPSGPYAPLARQIAAP